VTSYRLVVDQPADVDITSAFEWYERERAGLGDVFLGELRETFDRVVAGPLSYQELRSGIHRALTHRFPYAVYFLIDDDRIVVIAVLHARRDPAAWQRRA